MKKIAAFFILALSCTNAAHAAVTLDRTRLIIEAGEKENVVSVNTSPKSTVLLQTWTSTRDGKEIPFFTAVPPVSVVKENSQQQISVIYQGAGAPTDKESIFYLNLQDSGAMSPESQGSNTLNPTFLQVIKIFYRPPALKNKDPQKAAESLKWEIKNKTKNSYVLKVENPSPFNITFSGILLTTKNGNAPGPRFHNKDADLLEPFSSVEYVVQATSGGDHSNAALDKLVYVVVDDFGMSNIFYGTISDNSVLSITKLEKKSNQSKPAKEKTPKPPALEKIEFDTAPTNHGVDLESLVG